MLSVNKILSNLGLINDLRQQPNLSLGPLLPLLDEKHEKGRNQSHQIFTLQSSVTVYIKCTSTIKNQKGVAQPLFRTFTPLDRWDEKERNQYHQIFTLQSSVTVLCIVHRVHQQCGFDLYLSFLCSCFACLLSMYCTGCGQLSNQSVNDALFSLLCFVPFLIPNVCCSVQSEIKLLYF